MRKILFRGQTRRYGEKVRVGDGAKVPSHWVYGGVGQGISSHSIIYGGENVDKVSEGLDKWVVYTDTLGQFTGLTDKNGKKIFEGDIIKIPDDYDEYGHNAGEIFEVYFCLGGFRLKPKYSKARGYWLEDDETVEVIGNIHDNPELLGGKDGN